MSKHSFEAPLVKSTTIESLSYQLIELTEQLSKSNEELKRAKKEREAMLANISHDLRAPITAIRSAVDLLCANQEFSAADRESTLKLIDRRTKTLENLIQDMYYLFCVEDTSKEFQFEIVDAALFFEEYYYDAICDQSFNDYHMNLFIEPSLIASIHIDVQKMIRVMDNLFHNACKYSPLHSEITLSVSEAVHPQIVDSTHALSIKVTDNGVGIASEDIAHIFNRTFTVSSSRTPNSESGSGLGLSIVKTIVERHGGVIECSSELNKGSVFTITLPFQ